MQDQYDDLYYQKRYTQTLTNKIGLNKIYYIWIAFFCLIRAGGLRKKTKVLDFGCGIGSYVWALRKLGIEAYGIDASLSPKKCCQSPAFCHYSEHEILPYEDRYFDLVFSNEVLEHLSPEKINFCLQELQRISKGCLVHMVGVKERGSIVTEDDTHLIIEDENWWKNKFLEMGYRVRTGNLFYFFPCKKKWSRKGYFLLNAK